MTKEKQGWYSISIATYKQYSTFVEEQNANPAVTPKDVSRATTKILSILSGQPMDVINDLTFSQRNVMLSDYSFLESEHEPKVLKIKDGIYRTMLNGERFIINPNDIRGTEWEAFEVAHKSGDVFTGIAYLLRNEAAYDGLKYDFEAEDKQHTERLVNEYMSVGEAIDLSFFLQSYFLKVITGFLKSLRWQILRERMFYPKRWRRASDASKKAGSTYIPR